MKRRLLIVLIVSLLLSCFSFVSFAKNTEPSQNISVTPLRAGGGSSGGGGGGGGGGGSSHSHHSGSGRQPTLFESIFQFIMLPFILFSSSIVFYIKLSKRSRKSKKLMKQMMKSDGAWKYKNITSTVEECYFAVQNAWSEMDMTPASQYMSEKLFENFQSKLSWMSDRNEKNVLENIRLLSALPVSVYDDPDDSRDYIWFYIKGKMVDYTIDTSTQSKISGSSSAASFVEYWQFVRKNDKWVLNEILQKDESDKIPFTE